MATLDVNVTPMVAGVVLNFCGYDGYPAGGFEESLLNTFNRADSQNFERLYQAFPTYGEAMQAVKSADGVRQLQERMLAE